MGLSAHFPRNGVRRLQNGRDARSGVAPRRAGCRTLPPVELLLVRHALPVRLENVGVAADPELAPEGRLQAEALARRWADRVDAVWTSPMLRARETAAPLATAVEVEPTVDDDLAEMDRDAEAYIPMEELREDPAAWAEAVEAWVGPAGAALRAEFRLRVRAAIGRVVAAHRGQRVAVVCHGGVINAALADVLGLDEHLFFEPGYTSVSRVLANATGAAEVLSVNETWHWEARDLLL